MRKLATFLLCTLVAAALHFGAMAGLRVAMEFTTGHASHAEHPLPYESSCPVGSICPVIPSPLLNLDKNAPLFAAVLFVALFAAFRLPSIAAPPFVYARPKYSRPNDAASLLSVFKRE